MDFVQPNGSRSPERRCACGRRLWRTGAVSCSECCFHPSHELECTLARNGVTQYRRRCIDCGLAHGVKHAQVGPGEAAVMTANYTDQNHPCARCDNHHTEYHHFAPQAIFGSYEADCWPGAWLCRECHSIWHRQMRMAGGYKLEPARRLREATYTTYEQYQQDLWSDSPFRSGLGDTA